jgi:hypothetical protein
MTLASRSIASPARHAAGASQASCAAPATIAQRPWRGRLCVPQFTSGGARIALRITTHGGRLLLVCVLGFRYRIQLKDIHWMDNATRAAHTQVEKARGGQVMQLHYALFADAAEITLSGKLAMMGGNINTLRIPAFPTLVSPLLVVISLTVDEGETGQTHSIRVELTNPEGQNILPTQIGSFTPVSNPPESAELPVRFVSIANLSGLIVATPGMHWLRILVDDKQVGTAPLLVVHVPSPDGPGTNERED